MLGLLPGKVPCFDCISGTCNILMVYHRHMSRTITPNYINPKTIKKNESI